MSDDFEPDPVREESSSQGPQVDSFQPDPQNTNRWTKERTTPGEDPREIDQEQADPRLAARLHEHRQITHAEQETSDDLGTSSTTYDPTERS